ncbi:hypothetical protein GCM10027053_47320 [Intrasporangium mesophilum]
MNRTRLADLAAAQEGVVSRGQALACGLTDSDIARLVRRREWARVHDGIYVSHTGPLTWLQRAWAAVLFHAPAALAGRSALRVHRVRSESAPLRVVSDEPIHVVVDHRRRVSAPPGVIVSRRVGFHDVVQAHLSPPRLRLEEALLDVASRARSDRGAIGLLADACQEGRTTAERLRRALARRRRLPRHRVLLAVLRDIAEGAMSVLEQRYLVDVERRHGLPRARRQRRLVVRRGVTFRDVDYEELATTVELDGRWVHQTAAAAWLDFLRDVDTAVQGGVTVRVGWVHVLDPCSTAAALAPLLASRGWLGSPRRCSPTCAVGAG